MGGWGFSCHGTFFYRIQRRCFACSSTLQLARPERFYCWLTALKSLHPLLLCHQMEGLGAAVAAQMEAVEGHARTLGHDLGVRE